MSLGEILRAIRLALFTGKGEPWRDLEGLLRERFGADEVVACGSGTQALQAALGVAQAAVGQLSRSVALPAYTCFDVASAAIGAGLPVSFYDLDPETLGPDEESLAQAIAEGARTVVVSCLYGYPVAWDRIQEVVAGRDVVLIEDAAQGVGARWRARPLGSLGDLSVLSFGRGKGWTGGGGGALLVRRGLEIPLRRMKSLGIGKSPVGTTIALKSLIQWMLGRPRMYGLPARIPWLGLGETHYRPPRPVGAISAFSAALAAETAAASQREGASRRATARRLLESIGARDLRNRGIVEIRPTPDSEPGYLRLPVLIPALVGDQRLLAEARRLGINPGYPRTLPELDALDGTRVGGRRAFPGAERLTRELVTLPTHRFISPAVADAIVDHLSRAVHSEARLAR